MSEEKTLEAALVQAHRTASGLLEELSALCARVPTERQPGFRQALAWLQSIAAFLAGGKPPGSLGAEVPLSLEQRVQFGRLLRDKRNAAGLSRCTLARKARLSDATIKFVESGRHPPSRQTLIRLTNVPELKLRWEEVPGFLLPPRTEAPPWARAGEPTAASPPPSGPESRELLGPTVSIQVRLGPVALTVRVEAGPRTDNKKPAT